MAQSTTLSTLEPTRARRPATRARTSWVARADTGSGMWAILETANFAGAIVKLELFDDERRLLQVEIARDHYEGLSPEIGERLYVRPRKIRVFVGNVSDRIAR